MFAKTKNKSPSDRRQQALRILITGAAGQIGYALVPNIVNGLVFGISQPIILHLLDIEQSLDALNGIVLELEDCCFPNLISIIATCKPEEAFKDIDFAIMVGSIPRQDGSVRRDMLEGNAKIFKEQGQALDLYAKKTVRVVVVCNPANTICYILSKFAPSIPKSNFSALTRLDQNRAIFQLSKKANVRLKDVKNIIIWGNHSSTQYPDFHHGVIRNKNGKFLSIIETINDIHWLQNDFINTVALRGGAIVAARKKSSALSAAKAVCDHLKDWYFGTNSKDWVNMAVYSEGAYGAPTDVFFSFPVLIRNGNWEIASGLVLNDFSKSKLEITGKELEEEKRDALNFCS